jgi:hypothetical protein
MVGRKLKHYTIKSRLGEGGMGAVFVAEDSELHRDVALKVLPPELAADSDRLQRFRQEARAVAALNHPNIVTVYSVEQAEGLHFITMELVCGRPLSELIRKDGLPAERLLGLAVPLAEAVAAAHRRGIVHRDLKPDNVMLDEDGHLKVLDFGLAKLGGALAADGEATVTAEGRLLGTVAYMSPEQAQGKTVGPPSDVFSLGILLYEMATGQRPFEGDNQVSILTSIMRDDPRPISDLSVRPIGQLDDVVARCLKKSDADRYPTAAELAGDLRQLQQALATGSRPAISAARPTHSGRRVFLTVAALTLIGIVSLVTAWVVKGSARRAWARDEALPKIRQLIDASSGIEWGTRGWEALDLADEARKWIPDDPMLEQLSRGLSRPVTITSEPPGAEVLARPYSDPNGAWRRIGLTPLDEHPFARGASRVRVQLPGYDVAHDIVLRIGDYFKAWHFKLQPEGTIPEEMVFVPGLDTPLMLPGIDHLDSEPTADFLVDRHEVTNRRFKEFVDAGGYTNPDYWKHPFEDDANGARLSFEQAMARFVDTTGRPGPAGWEVGDYAEGEDDLPVAGVSWYEAAAYAEWAGKTLPSIFHWNQVALTWASGEIIPLGNFDGEGVRPVGEGGTENRYGAFDLAGNVREWCRNGSTRGNVRFILGGGHGDEGWAFNDAFAQSAWDRSEINGFRCMRYLKPEDERPELTRTIEVPFRDFRKETPVSDETFAIFKRQFEYDRTPLNATIESEDEYDDWIRQRVHYDAAYGGERVQAWLFVPKGSPPYRTIVYFPGSNAIHADSSMGRTGQGFSFLLKTGRAVMLPIYKGTYERGDELDSDYPEETNFYKDHVIMWGKDLARSIDYLESRDDMDTSSLAFYGASWGGVMGTILPAIEPRIKVNLLYIAGLLFQRALPEVDQINYVGQVRQPTLMVNGEFDFFFPLETSQKPLFELLGAPEDRKRYVVYPGSHSVPRGELVRELLEWLDRWQ